MSREELIQYYKEQIEWHKKEVEYCNREIEWIGKRIKEEKYEWGYSLIGESYIKQRRREYRSRKWHKDTISYYEKQLERLVA